MSTVALSHEDYEKLVTIPGHQETFPVKISIATQILVGRGFDISRSRLAKLVTDGELPPIGQTAGKPGWTKELIENAAVYLEQRKRWNRTAGFMWEFDLTFRDFLEALHEARDKAISNQGCHGYKTSSSVPWALGCEVVQHPPPPFLAGLPDPDRVRTPTNHPVKTRDWVVHRNRSTSKHLNRHPLDSTRG